MTPPHGLGVDVVSLARWSAFVERHGARFSDAWNMDLAELSGPSGAACFALAECRVKAGLSPSLWQVLEQPPVLRDLVWRAQHGCGGAWRVKWPGSQASVAWDAICVARSGAGEFTAVQWEGHVVAWWREVHVASCWIAVERAAVGTSGDAARRVLQDLAGAQARDVQAPSGARPWVGVRAASLAHDGDVVVAALECAVLD